MEEKRLEYYIQEMESCVETDEKVEDLAQDFITKAQAEYGLYDNYCLLANKEYDLIKEIIKSSEKFEIYKDAGSSTYFNYTPGIMLIQISSELKTNPTSRIRFHPYQEKNMKDISWKEAQSFGSKKSNIALIRSLKDITNILTEKDISFSLRGKYDCKNGYQWINF